MPPSCVTRGEIAGNFTSWKNSVVEYKQPVGEEALPGLYSKRVLAQHLTPEIHRIRISPDGRYVLAQDENNIFVLTRQPLKPVFQFEAPGATGAKFTPDSQDVVFTMGGFGESPRVEKWNIASQKRSEVHEIHVAKGCLTHAVSPDGKTLACTTDATNEYAFKLDLDLYDTGTATSYWHKSDWVAITSSYDLYFRQQLYFNLLAQNEAYFSNLSRLRFSADGHYLLAHSPNNTLCMDLFNRVTVSLPNEVKSAVSQGVFTFVGQDKLVGMNDYTNWTAELIQFPSGRLFAKNIQIGRADVLAVAHGDFILLSPLKDNPLGVLDLRSQTLALASKRITLDIWDDQYIAEQLDGTLQVFDLKTAKPLETAHLPEAPIPKLTAADVSPDLKWLAISHKTRGAVWNLETGEQTYKVRGFRGVYFDPDNGIYADFPKFAQTDRTIVRMPLPKQAIEAKRTLTDKEHARQFGKYLLKFVPAKENNPNSRDVTVEIHDIHDDQLLWSKRFPQGPPDGWITSETRSLILHWPAGSKPIKALAKDDQDAASKLAPYHDKAGIVFLQVIALDTGKVQSQMAIDTGKNSFTPKGISVSANRVVLFDNENRVLVYSLDGKPLSVFQGRGYSISSTALLVQEEAQSRQAALYDLSTLEKRAVYRFSSPVVFSSFSADGKRMLVLTNDQTVYTFEISTETEAQGKPTTG